MCRDPISLHLLVVSIPKARKIISCFVAYLRNNSYLCTKYNGMQYRLLAFWDEQEKRLVVATHGFVKKTWKVPQKEIARAEALRKKYYESK
ncbi:MAG: type II toxin-antitoxin system RelE/ParE family toxin [Prevotella sp.]|nr:type II toxin-antitoxin system RelE/ParE family toxin [Prevotella sp.]